MCGFTTRAVHRAGGVTLPVALGLGAVLPGRCRGPHRLQLRGLAGPGAGPVAGRLHGLRAGAAQHQGGRDLHGDRAQSRRLRRRAGEGREEAHPDRHPEGRPHRGERQAGDLAFRRAGRRRRRLPGALRALRRAPRALDRRTGLHRAAASPSIRRWDRAASPRSTIPAASANSSWISRTMPACPSRRSTQRRRRGWPSASSMACRRSIPATPGAPATTRSRSSTTASRR